MHGTYDIIKAAGYHPIFKRKEWFEQPSESQIGNQRLFALYPLPDEEWTIYIYKEILDYCGTPNITRTCIFDRMKQLRKYIRLVLSTPYSQIVKVSPEDHGIYRPYDSELYYPKLKTNYMLLHELGKIGDITGWWKMHHTSGLYRFMIDGDKHKTIIPIVELRVRSIYTAQDKTYIKNVALELRKVFGKDIATLIAKYIYKKSKLKTHNHSPIFH